MLIFQYDIDTPSVKMWDLGYIEMLALGTPPQPTHTSVFWLTASADIPANSEH